MANEKEIKKVSIEEDAEFILNEAGINASEGQIAEAVSIMERALEDAIEDGEFSENGELDEEKEEEE